VTVGRLATGVGLAALAAGATLVFVPGVPGLDLDRVLVSVVGVLALALAWRLGERRRREGLDEATTPDPERPVASAPPGADLGSAVDAFLDTRHIHRYRTRLREGLRAAAVAVLTQYGSRGQAEAEAAVADGTWTDDVHAAAFLGDDDAPDRPRGAWLADAVGGTSSHRRGVRRAVDAVASVADVTPRPDDHPGGRSGDCDDAPAVTTTRPDGVDDAAGAVRTREAHGTGHWSGVGVVALVGIGVGVLVEEPAVLLAGVVGVGFAAYARSTPLRPGPVSLERTLSTDRAGPGDDVEVTVTVTNEGDRALPDLRLVDGVPEALPVSDGAPRFGTALRPGERATFTYAVGARRGVHDFGPAALVARDLTGAVETEWSLPAGNTLTCVPPLRALPDPVPLRDRATRFVGRVETADGGDGVEFAATREYRRGDSMRRIDWNRRARTGELTTVEYREERSATVVVVVDARKTAYVAPASTATHAVDRAVDAAGAVVATLLASGDRVGLTALSAEPCWLAPGSGADHRTAARELLATHPALRSVPPAERSATTRWRRRLRRRLSPGTQVVFLTPLHDAYAARFARLLDAYGHPVTVVSPDATADRTAGHRLARVARTLRCSRLRSAGVPVVDWGHAEPLAVALARYDERRSR
jgi:uncharacterized protein (DUF58 family)